MLTRIIVAVIFAPILFVLLFFLPPVWTAALAALIASQLLLAIEVLNTFTVTLQVLSAGAVWLVPAATLTVMVTVP